MNAVVYPACRARNAPACNTPSRTAANFPSLQMTSWNGMAEEPDGHEAGAKPADRQGRRR
ncbi:hypothetical protein BX283_0168 [Streptomyces sp. TLI_146]|nr:hypothetical protein BX283_0168 [Streptomyces sp. TLI_146]